MAVLYTGLVASGQSNQADLAKGKDLIEQIFYFEQQSSIIEHAPGDSKALAAERLQSSACFDCWAKPDVDYYDRRRH